MDNRQLKAWDRSNKPQIFTLVGCGECNEPHQNGLFKAIDAVRSSPHPTSEV